MMILILQFEFLNSKILPALLAQLTNSVSHLSLTKTEIPHSANLSVLLDELYFSVSLLATGRKKIEACTLQSLFF